MFSRIFNKVFKRGKNVEIKDSNLVAPKSKEFNSNRSFSTVLSKAFKRRLDNLHEKIIKGNTNIDRVRKIDTKDEIFFLISNSVYEKPENRHDIGNYFIDNKYSDEENAVYINYPKKEIIIGHRGSKVSKDFVTDLRLTMSGIRSTSRYKRTEELVEKIKKENPNYTVMFTGHSLGGSLAIENARKLGDKAVVFNSGYSPLTKTNYKNTDITYYTNKGDTVSLFGSNKFKNTKLLDKKDQSLYQSHALESFKPNKLSNFKLERRFSADMRSKMLELYKSKELLDNRLYRKQKRLTT